MSMMSLPLPPVWLLPPLLLLLVCLIALRKWLEVRAHHLPPGASHKVDTSVPLCEYLRQLGLQLDSDLVTVYHAQKAIVALNTYEAVQEAFVTLSPQFAGRPWSLAGHIATEGGRDIKNCNYGTRWNHQRRLVTSAMKRYADQNTVSSLVGESCSDVCELMVQEQEERGLVGKLEEKLYLLVYNVMAVILFGKRFGPSDPDFLRLTTNITTLNEIFGRGFLADSCPCLSFVPTPSKRRLQHTMRNIWDFLNHEIMTHRSTLNEDRPRDVTDALLLSGDCDDDDGDVHVRQVLSDMFMAGTDTTCFTLLWIIAYLIHYPHLQEQVYAEVRQQVGHRTPVASDKPSLVYTEAFMLEAMRLRPVAPLALPHTALNTTKLRGYTFTKGITVVPNIWACHHDPHYWSDPDRFNPDRFLSGLHPPTLIPRPPSFIPFGVGKRVCAGERLARLDTLLIFATLVKTLRFRAAPLSAGPDLQPSGGLGPFACVPPAFDVRVERR